MAILEESIISYDNTSQNFNEIMEKSFEVNKKQEEFISKKLDTLTVLESQVSELQSILKCQFIPQLDDHKTVLSQNHIIVKEMTKLFKERMGCVEDKIKALTNKHLTEYSTKIQLLEEKAALVHSKLSR